MKEGSWFQYGFNVKQDQSLLQSQEMAIYLNETWDALINIGKILKASCSLYHPERFQPSPLMLPGSTAFRIHNSSRTNTSSP
jgi:hypothetical protein